MEIDELIDGSEELAGLTVEKAWVDPSFCLNVKMTNGWMFHIIADDPITIERREI